MTQIQYRAADLSTDLSAEALGAKVEALSAKVDAADLINQGRSLP